MHARQRVDPEVQRYWEGVLESVTKPTARAMLKELDTGRLLGLPVRKRMLTMCACTSTNRSAAAMLKASRRHVQKTPASLGGDDRTGTGTQ